MGALRQLGQCFREEKLLFGGLQCLVGRDGSAVVLGEECVGIRVATCVPLVAKVIPLPLHEAVCEDLPKPRMEAPRPAMLKALQALMGSDESGLNDVLGVQTSTYITTQSATGEAREGLAIAPVERLPGQRVATPDALD